MDTTLEFSVPEGGTLRFNYTGVTQYYPNLSSASGCGDDQWMLLCEREGRACILDLTYSGEFGAAVWTSLLLPGPATRWLGQAEGLSLREAYFDHYDSNALRHHLHPTDLERIKAIIVPSLTRTGPLTDADYIGK